MATRKSSRLSAQAAKAVHAEANTRDSSKRKLPDENQATPESPLTPPPKRRARTAAATDTGALSAMATPTPDTVKLMAAPASGALVTPKASGSRAIHRHADPNVTNATLLSPGTSRIVTSQRSEPVGPAEASGAEATTESILEVACRHLIQVDARMGPLIKKHHCRIFSPEGLAEKVDPFEALASGVISQQVSGAAARSIKNRFIALFDEEKGSPTTPDGGASMPTTRFPAPSAVASCSLDRLRTAGLSQRKAEYIQGLATKFTDSELSTHMLADAPYEDVLERLTAVRGLGRWSVEMFACFALKRLDVFSLGDLGVQRGMAAFVGRDVAKLKTKGGKWKYMAEKEMEEISAKFAPYRSLFMWYMWRVEETDVSTLEV